ncbi:hypothetical protein ACN28S_09955 [Cystobacter fuscus]
MRRSLQNDPLKRPVPLGLVALLLPALTLAAQQEPRARATQRPSRQYSIEQFMATTRVEDASFSPDEQHVLLSSNETGVFNVYAQPTAAAGPRRSPTRGRTAPTPSPGFPGTRGCSTHATRAATRTTTSTCVGSTARRGISRRARSSRPTSSTGAVTTAPST